MAMRKLIWGTIVVAALGHVGPAAADSKRQTCSPAGFQRCVEGCYVQTISCLENPNCHTSETRSNAKHICELRCKANLRSYCGRAY